MTVGVQSKAPVPEAEINPNCDLLHCYNNKTTFLYFYDDSLTAVM